MRRHHVLFADRAAAGRLLGERLRGLGLDRPVVYALPRGGVPVAAEIAASLGGAPLDLLLVRKIGAPGQEELALGAVAELDAGSLVVLNPDIVAMTGADAPTIERIRAREVAEMARRRRAYLGDRTRPDPRGRAAVVVDDGIATGATARAALRALRGRGAARTLLAVPVAPPDAVATLRRVADEVVCLAEDALMRGVGGCYADFHQVSDAEVVALLDVAARAAGEGEGEAAGTAR